MACRRRDVMALALFAGTSPMASASTTSRACAPGASLSSLLGNIGCALVSIWKELVAIGLRFGTLCAHEPGRRQARSFGVTKPAMAVPQGVKYAVIGAGIHGLSTAYHLAQALAGTGKGSGKDILVLDKTAI